MDEFEKSSKGEKFLNVLKLTSWLIFLFIVSEFLLALNNEEIFKNWGIGLGGMITFGLFYIIDINHFPFTNNKAINKFNLFMITFFLAWLVADWDDFIHTLALTMIKG